MKWQYIFCVFQHQESLCWKFMVQRTISCISVGTLSHPSRRMPYNTPLPLPSPPPHPPKKKTQTQKQQSNFFYDLLVHLCTRKGEISKKKTFLPCIAGVSPVCECFFQWQCFYSTVAQQLFKVPAFLYSLLVCGKVAFQQTLDVFADRYYQLCTTFFPGSFLLPCSKPQTWLVYISDI